MIQFDNAVERYNKVILAELTTAGINCWLAGGVLRDYFMGIYIKTDYDLFFPDEAEYKKAERYFLVNGAKVKWESDNGMKVVYNGNIYDLVKKFFATPQETIDNFDFTVSMFAVDGKTVYHGETSFIDLSKRQLMMNKITYPASTMKRAFRYYKKGFSMCVGEMKKLIEAIQAMPIEANNTQPNEGDEMSSGDMAKFFIGID